MTAQSSSPGQDEGGSVPDVPGTQPASADQGTFTVDLLRRGFLPALVLVVLTGPLAWGCVVTALAATDGGTRVMGFIFGALFGVLALFGLVGVPLTLLGRNRHRLVIDRRGLAVGAADAPDLIPWSAVAAVATSYKLPPRLSTSEFLMQRFTRGLTRRRERLEIYLKDPQPRQHPRGWRPFWLPSMNPLGPELPSAAYCIGLPTMTGTLTKQIGDAVRANRPDVWFGDHKRPWASTLRRYG